MTKLLTILLVSLASAALPVVTGEHPLAWVFRPVVDYLQDIRGVLADKRAHGVWPPKWPEVTK